MELTEEYLFSTSKNISFLFLLPVLGINDKIKENGFINCYLKDKNKEHDSDNHLLYCLFKPKSTFSFEKMLDELDDIIEDEYDYPGDFVVVVFRFPDRWKDDWQHILDGKYSQVSQEYKELFPEYHPTDYSLDPPTQFRTLQNMVFIKAPALRDHICRVYNIHYRDWDQTNEVFHLYNQGHETLTIENI